MFRTLAESFPVSCSSDEFYFFPHIKLPEPQWQTWDFYSDNSVEKTTRFLLSCEKELKELAGKNPGIDEQIDIRLLIKFARTLREQLSIFELWKIQPTFYLTIICKGLEEAVQSENPAAVHDMAATLPGFLDQASVNLSLIPEIYSELGLEMVEDTRHYIDILSELVPDLKKSAAALKRFEDTIRKASVREKQYFPEGMLEYLMQFHFATGMNIQEIDSILDREIEEMNSILTAESGKVISKHNFPAYTSWKEVYDSLPLPFTEGEAKIGLFEHQVSSNMNHCLEQGFVSKELAAEWPVHVAGMPTYMSAIRSASSYSISLEQPSKGGTFYILDTDKNRVNLHDYKMLTAHETYPGHHLLDSSRLGLPRICRRAVEQPVFYEGWACFAEELMSISGKFNKPEDKLILAKRRLWRAVRGKIDLGLQTGKMKYKEAAEYMERMTGISDEKSLNSLKKYTLNPGYQTCYTLGIRKFIELYDKYGRNNLASFVNTILSQGEIGFDDLEQVINNSIK